MDKRKFYIYRQGGSPVIHVAGESAVKVEHIDCRVPTWSLTGGKAGVGVDFVMCGMGIVVINYSDNKCVITNGE